ncbi:hypothetical protein [Acidimangrovimonas pyrenivorans]|uniref:Uncharacterized protein n=1 Tax=Acidimangrovimonas pyrenivorans TaxID=2030798 RepID=A0ABV7AP07_9RHOB
MTADYELRTGWPEWIDKTEGAICNKLITAILNRGFCICVRDEDGRIRQAPTIRRSDIQRQTGQTRITFYDVMREVQRDLDGTTGHMPFGRFLLVHGNRKDVVGDYSCLTRSPESERVMQDILGEATRSV